MNARQRINQYYSTISILIATWIGLVANSWIVFGVAAGILLGLYTIGGAIRMGGGRHAPPRRWSPNRTRFRRHTMSHDE